MLRARQNLRKCLESNRVCHLSVYSRARQIDHEYSLDTLHKIFPSLALALSLALCLHILNGCGQDCQTASAEKEGVREGVYRRVWWKALQGLRVCGNDLLCQRFAFIGIRCVGVSLHKYQGKARCPWICHFIYFVLRRYIRLGKKFKGHFSQSFLPFKQSVFHAMPLTPFFEKQ